MIGSHLRVKDSREPTDGWITSAGISILSHQPIALAMLRGGRALVGADVDVYDEGSKKSSARVVNLPFLDPAGERMNA
jgi:glycine cleavage system aminomethyltransferase T